MSVDWAEVDELVKPTPSYEKLIEEISEVWSYGFVQETYCHDMGEAVDYLERLMGGDPRARFGETVERYGSIFRRLAELGVDGYGGFLDSVRDREELERFYKASGLPMRDIIGSLRYLLRWLLPSKIYLSQLIDREDTTQKEHVTALRSTGIRFTLDILEKGMTAEARRQLAVEAGVPFDFVTDLVNRVDLTRMPYINGKTVRHYFGAGYTSLTSLASADLETLQRDVRKCLSSQGIRLSRSFIELDSGIQIAGVLPRIVEA